MRRLKNAAISERLKAAAQDWVKEKPERKFEKDRRMSLRRLMSPIFYLVLLAVVLLSVSTISSGPLILTLALPLWALATVERLMMIRHQLKKNEAVQMLPLSDQLIVDQLRSEGIRLILKRFWLPLMAGFLMLNGSEVFPIGAALSSAFVYLCFLGVLSLGLTPRLLGFIPILKFGLGFVVVVFIFSETFRAKFATVIISLPWYDMIRLESPFWGYVIFGILSLGTLMFTKRFWHSVGPYDRTRFYEHDGAHLFRASGEGFEGVPLAGHPSGLLEKWIWKMFSSKERSLARAVGFCEERFLRNWLALIAVYLLLIWLWVRFEFEFILWPVLIELIAAFYLSRNCFSIALIYLKNLTISPHNLAPCFHVLPIGPQFLEKMAMKESYLKLGIVSLTPPFLLSAYWIISESSDTIEVGQFLEFWLSTYLAFLCLHLTLFWNQMLTKCLSPKTGGFLNYYLASGILALAAVSCGALILIALFMRVDSEQQLWLGFIVIPIFLYGFVFLTARMLLTSKIANPRNDLAFLRDAKT